MDSNNQIFCPIHPTEEIKRIDVEFGQEKEIYCIECLLSLRDPTSVGAQLKPLNEFIDIAAKFYESNRKRISNNVDTPDEYLEILSRQSENLEAISKKIEDEKKRVQLKFDELIQDLVKIVNTKRDEYFHLLDKQLFNYRYAYIFFEKQLRKAYPKADDLNLFPTKEELSAKLGKLQNATQLMAFVKSIKEDIHESKLFGGEMEWLTPEEARIILIKNLSKKLDGYKSKSPTLIDPEADINKIKQEFEKAITKVTDDMFNLQNEIEDVAQGDGPKSSIIKSQDFHMIKKWLEKEFSNRKWKLLFRGSKDGHKSSSFHEKCNNKGPTVTIIKSKAGKIFGGFLDLPWRSSNTYLNTKRAFLFSVTEKKKCPMISDSYSGNAACDYPNYGPTFGGGHDIYLAADWTTNQNYCNKNSYDIGDCNSFAGGYNFTVEEVEVYSLDK